MEEPMKKLMNEYFDILKKISYYDKPALDIVGHRKKLLDNMKELCANGYDVNQIFDNNQTLLAHMFTMVWAGGLKCFKAYSEDNIYIFNFLLSIGSSTDISFYNPVIFKSSSKKRKTENTFPLVLHVINLIIHTIEAHRDNSELLNATYYPYDESSKNPFHYNPKGMLHFDINARVKFMQLKMKYLNYILISVLEGLNHSTYMRYEKSIDEYISFINLYNIKYKLKSILSVNNFMNYIFNKKIGFFMRLCKSLSSKCDKRKNIRLSNAFLSVVCDEYLILYISSYVVKLEIFK